MNTQYVGITDFETPEQVKRMLNNVTPMTRIKLHVGLMTSRKLIQNDETRWRDLWLPLERISEPFIEDPRVYNVVHYADYDKKDVTACIAKVLEAGGNRMHAIQLDMVWPDPKDVFHAMTEANKYRDVILQIGKNAFDEVKNQSDVIIARLESYGRNLSHVLLDLSMGKGQALDSSFFRPYIEKIHQSIPYLGIVVAGGIGPDSTDLVAPLIKDYGEFLSIDAQSQLHYNAESFGRFDPNRGEKYLKEAFRYYSLYQPLR